MIRPIAIAAFATVLGLSHFAAAVVYSYNDTTFVNADWVGVKYADTSTPTGSFTAVQANPGGSTITPGPQTPNYRAITHNFGGPGAGAINVTHQDVNFNWTPLPLETASTVDYTYDLNFFDNTGAFGAVGFSPAIFQGGAVYRLPSYDNVFGPSAWQRFGNTGIPLSTFQKMDPTTAALTTGSVNQSAAMSFGFVSSNSANQFVTKNSGLDDYGFTLNTKVAPEPATLTAAAALGAMVCRRNRLRVAI